ncbi:2-dehydropantoate 2-reductase N-terminal domain-containing protein [Saccharibacillus sp. CPCC 101409]|uniref:ketopantoate reductase family protein n=1 Tax=Saccharibacillus sp. CPCC 101409 TaxID=3058041 RepID=UPI002672066A|nr:2-dehydropantoate 2-reductase N-terminal domain-containing protein [Saccharibacillus sp. CPCC 101409]MDO3412493.1 2-dehydropantoate 2-reductase N-terminal domain-containing protein [Saccharibacillus sp. CPCC 101409]
MNKKTHRLLIVGAGVIGSVYALRLLQSGADITLLARGERLNDLRRHGLRYNENGDVKQVPVQTIGKLEPSDRYDYILVPVRYDQAESALADLRRNDSPTIVTLTNTVGYDAWTQIVGDRLLPGFPGAGGDIKNGVLHARFGSDPQQGTYIGEISGQITERVRELAGIFETAGLHVNIETDILAFHVSHTALAAVNKHFYTEDGMVDADTAKSDPVLSRIAADIKRNLRWVERAGIAVIPSDTKRMGELTEKEIMALYREMLSSDFILDVKLGRHAVKARPEIMLLDEHFRKKLSASF